MDIGNGKVPIGIPLGVVICHVLLQPAVQLCIAVVEEEVSQILLLDTIDHSFLSGSDRVS